MVGNVEQLTVCFLFSRRDGAVVAVVEAALLSGSAGAAPPAAESAHSAHVSPADGRRRRRGAEWKQCEAAAVQMKRLAAACVCFVHVVSWCTVSGWNVCHLVLSASFY